MSRLRSFLASVTTKSYVLDICLFVTDLAYLPLLRNGFVNDDHAFVENWPELNHPNLISIFKGSVPQGQEGVYRPLRSVMYAAVYSIDGKNPLIFHAYGI